MIAYHGDPALKDRIEEGDREVQPHHTKRGSAGGGAATPGTFVAPKLGNTTRTV